MIDAIKEMEDCKRVHLEWALHQEDLVRCGCKEMPHVGSAKRHREFIKIYNEVLRCLQEHQELKTASEGGA